MGGEISANDTNDLIEDSHDPLPVAEIKKQEEKVKQISGSGSVSKTDAGTPIVELHSPFASLPKYANFGKDMTEHIVFDNLPNYTGTWEKMSGLIQRIRSRTDAGEDNS